LIGDVRNEFGRHKIAFYSEEEIQNFLRLTLSKGATQIISNYLLFDSSPTSTLRNVSPTSTIKSFDHNKRPLRPISENLQYLEEESIYEEIRDVEESSTMPTQINSNSSKILRRKSTGSSDTSKSTNVFKKKSPTSSTVSVSSVELKFQRQNSMTGRFKKSSNTVWYNNNRSNLIDNSVKNDSDDYYDDEALTDYNERLKSSKKKSHNSLESEEMTSGNTDF
jgi:hypothetical protein